MNGKEMERTSRGKVTKGSLSIQACGTSATMRSYKKVKHKPNTEYYYGKNRIAPTNISD